MTDNNGTRSGSLQFYPRVRAKKLVPTVNWKPVSSEKKGIMGFLGYKVGMASVYAKDVTEHSMTKGKRIVMPATIVECPTMKIYSVRFYKNSKVVKDIIVSSEKELKRRVKLPKVKKEFAEIEDYDDVRVLLFSNVKDTGIGKKKPDMMEVGISGSKEDKINFVKEKLNKEISITEVFDGGLIDIRAVTKGFGTQGPVKRFGIALKSHKSEKGVRRPGSLAPWHPARTTFRAAQAGQHGFHTRMDYNNLILNVGKISEKDINTKSGFHNYGKIKTDYIIIRGSIPGTKNRPIVMTTAIRPTKYQAKKSFEFIELR